MCYGYRFKAIVSISSLLVCVCVFVYVYVARDLDIFENWARHQFLLLTANAVDFAFGVKYENVKRKYRRKNNIEPWFRIILLWYGVCGTTHIQTHTLLDQKGDGNRLEWDVNAMKLEKYAVNSLHDYQAMEHYPYIIFFRWVLRQNPTLFSLLLSQPKTVTPLLLVLTRLPFCNLYLLFRKWIGWAIACTHCIKAWTRRCISFSDGEKQKRIRIIVTMIWAKAK